jgi:hypothetical protein
MSAPHFAILTQQEIPMNLSRPAIQYILAVLTHADEPIVDYDMEGELDNFVNILENLLERSEPKPGNFDLIGG